MIYFYTNIINIICQTIFLKLSNKSYILCLGSMLIVKIIVSLISFKYITCLGFMAIALYTFYTNYLNI
jgi:hypothetical protein